MTSYCVGLQVADVRTGRRGRLLRPPPRNGPLVLLSGLQGPAAPVPGYKSGIILQLTLDPSPNVITIRHHHD